MKKLLYLIALTGLCAQPSYGMEKEKHDKECENCINVGPCNWENLAAQLSAMYALQQISSPVQTQETQQPNVLDAQKAISSVTHPSSVSGRTEADVTSENGSDDSWESWSDGADWPDSGDDADDEKEKND